MDTSNTTPGKKEGVKKKFDESINSLGFETKPGFDWVCSSSNCNYQKLINSISLIYTGPDVELIEKNIPFVLQTLAKFTGADHIAVCSTSSNYKLIQSYNEWNAPDAEFLEGHSGKVTNANMLKHYYPVHKLGKSIYISSVEKAPDEHTELKGLMRLYGIRSLLSYPLMHDGILIGNLEFFYLNHYTDFQERDLSLLRYFAEMQSNVSQRIQHLRKWVNDADNYVNRQRGYEKELKKAREDAEAAKRIKDTFFVNLSHEIRTPLNIITGMHRELLREKLNSRQMKFIKQTFSASRYLLSLFNNVMDINDIETGTFQLNQKNFNLRQLLLEVKDMMAGKAAEKKSIEFQLIISESVTTAYRGDAQRLQQILIKLLSNAFKFTNEGIIRLEVSVRRKTSGFHEMFFEISDTGIGMSKAFMEKAFGRFEKEDSSMSRIHEGAGLGLHICYQLTKLMGGTINVESEKDKGTQFHVTLPFQLGDDKELQEQSSKTAGYDFSNLKILLVEDNDTNRFIARQTLRNTKCQIIDAVNGQEAVELVRQHNFDLILMDIQMPVMNGMEATRIIRNELKMKMPIIAFTANAVDSEIVKYMSFGMEDFIVKPYRENDLYAKIEKFTRTQTEVMKTEQESEKLYDLSYLNELSQGDESFTRQIIETFLVMANQSVEQLKMALSENDLKAIQKIAHKIKPTLSNFQITSVKGIVDKLNNTDPELLSEEDLKTDVGKVIDVLTTVQKQLAEHIQ